MESNSDGNLMPDDLKGVTNSKIIEAVKVERSSGHNNVEFAKPNGQNSSGLNHDEEDELDIDVVGCAQVSGRLLDPMRDDDTESAEYSSSFGETSDSAEANEREASDMEVCSSFHGESSDSTPFNRAFRVCRRKKLTPHWQRYIRALKWRCNWLELRINELQARNMERKRFLLAAEKEKSVYLAAAPATDSAARVVSLSFEHGACAMKRRRRKRVEESADPLSYMASHTVFSLLEKGAEAEGHSIDDGHPENGLSDPILRGHDGMSVDHDWPSMDRMAGENSLELLLLQIETVQEKVVKLRMELDMAVDWGAGRVSLNSEVVAVTNAVTSPGLSRSALLGCDGDGMPPGGSTPNYLSEYEGEDPAMSEGAMSSFGDATPNIIESTVNLLSADRNAHMDVGDEILISNRAAKEELEDFEKVGRAMERGSDGARVSGSETSTETERTVSEEPIVLRRCSEAATVTYVRRSKRPRTERRLSPSSWHCEKVGRRRSAKTREHS
ncbi:uncharacterized protein LOC144701734 [Wolffia australiana]